MRERAGRQWNSAPRGSWVVGEWGQPVKVPDLTAAQAPFLTA